MSTSSARRVIVVEDDALTASLLAAALTAAGFGVATALDVERAIALVDSFDPDAALIDIDLGRGPSGIDLAHVLATTAPHIALLFLTRYPDARAAGVDQSRLPAQCGFLRKDRVSDSDYLLAAVESVLGDRPRDVRHDLAGDSPLAGLTEQQFEVLRMAASAMTNGAIARARGTTERTVERLLAAAFDTLGVSQHPDTNPRVEAIRRFVAVAGLPAQPSESIGLHGH